MWGLFLTSILIILSIYKYNYLNDLSDQDGWRLRIMHTNDMHARFDEISSTGYECIPRLKAEGKCYGGFARIATLVRQARNSMVTTLYLDAGDYYEGTPWFTIYGWQIASKFLNSLQPDAVSFGNHEFDNGLEGLIPFIEAATFPILCSNLNVTQEPALAATNLKKSIILNINSRKIGIIGYVTPETKKISNTPNIIFLDEIESIKTEVEKLRAENVSILIALGHSGYETDKKIATEVDGLDLVIGGHTGTFLYNGTQPDIEIAENFYPTIITQKTGRKVYVVQAFMFTKYLGNLTIDFDNFGEIRNIFGNPILVNSSIEQAQDVVEELEKWRSSVVNITKRVLGYSNVVLYHDSRVCRMRECNFGNLITDAMVYSRNETDVAVAVINSGLVKKSIYKVGDTPITFGDILMAMPHPQMMEKVEMTGEQIIQMLEHSVESLNVSATNLSGKFLHFSGLKVHYDLSKPKNRVVAESVLIKCTDCRLPKFEKLQMDKIYKILAPNYLQKGGDGYIILKYLKWTPTGVKIDEAVAEFIKKRGKVYPKNEKRIQFVNK